MRRKTLTLLLAIFLILAGFSLMILFQHQTLWVIWTDPMSILWSDAPPRAGVFWWIGPTFLFLGIAIIAEDYFGFGQPTPGHCSKDSALRAGKTRAGQRYAHDRLEPPRGTTSQSRRR